MVEPAEIRYESGQFIILHAGSAPPVPQVPVSPTPAGEVAGKPIKRSYSIASAPTAKGFSVCVKIVGLASRFLADLKPGDPVKFSGPWGKGKFTFPDETETNIVMLATGTGLSPIQSHLLSRLPVHTDKTFLLLWGLKREEDIYNREMLDELANRYAHFSYSIILSEPGPTWQGKRGVLSVCFSDEIGPPVGKEFFLAGNGAMIETVEGYLKAHGAAPAKIHKEVFFLPEI